MMYSNNYPRASSARQVLASVCLGVLFASKLTAQNTVITELAIKANQGVAVDESYIYAISNTSIEKCDKQSGEVVAAWQADKKIAAEKHFKHLNSGAVIEGKLYCAHSRFPVAINDCSVEIFDIKGETLKHVETIPLPSKHGSLTWIDRRDDGTWWMCYAVYGKKNNSKTKLIQYSYQDGKFIEQASYNFPAEVVGKWGSASCSGGSWGPDALLYTTGHDHAQAHVLHVDAEGKLNYRKTEKNTGFYGQGIAWDRFAKTPALWGIVKKRKVTATQLAARN